MQTHTNFSIDNKTVVLPSARAIRHEQLSLKDITFFLPNYITMSEFISKLCIVDDFVLLDDDTRVTLLLEASDFKAFSSLQIERNFFTFTKNSSYIFKFFQELSAEKYDIKDLSLSDIYGEYEEHISILIELYERYETLCLKKKYLDKIFLPSLYRFNTSYAKMHKDIEIKVEGHLTNFEFELLEKCTEFASLKIIFAASNFNMKMQQKLASLGFKLEVGYKYRLSLNTKEILEKEPTIKNNNISCESFSESLLQVAFVKSKIFEFMQKGYAAQNIAVILPNESMADILRSFDEKANLNFAMGESYAKSTLYIKLHATIKYIDLDSKENEARLQRVGDELFLSLHSIYYKDAKEVNFMVFLESVKEFCSVKQEMRIYEEELHAFKKLNYLMQGMSVKSLLSIFMQRLAKRSLDDVRGGKITVMGLLETRSVSFDAVIIVDFDDKNVPKRSDKDMFLNSQIREMAQLPTMLDRENLQKHYYETLINESKEIAISYVSSEESRASQFLKELDVETKNVYDEKEYSEILFRHTMQTPIHFQDKYLEYSFKDVELSATRLKIFLSCKRKYYLKYIQGVKNHTIPTDIPQEYEIGSQVHLALKELYSKKSFYTSAKELQKDLERELDGVCGLSELDKYLIAMQKKRLKEFTHNEITRFQEGWKVEACEKSLKRIFEGLTLVGQIDRIDKNENELEVLDYKTGSYTLNNKNNFTEATDFQLEFYYLLASELGDVKGCCFYDLKESKIVPEAFLSEKLEILKSHIKDLLLIEEIDTQMCEDEKNCLYCEYKVICERE